MAMIEIKLNNTNRDQVLYYESGFEQLHPQLHIIEWMESHGWKYYEDWKCTNVKHTFRKRSYYRLEFATEEMASMFALKWL